MQPQRYEKFEVIWVSKTNGVSEYENKNSIKKNLKKKMTPPKL